MSKRPISFEQAKAQYVNRYTMDFIPAWADVPVDMTINGKGPQYYAPQFASDREWYDATKFKGELGWLGTGHGCYTTGQTWPLDQWLERPYRPYMSGDDIALDTATRVQYVRDRMADDKPEEA